MRLSVKAFALTAGLFWGFTVFVSTLIAVYSGYLSDQLQWLVGLYPWYEITINGAFIGLAEAFVDGFLGGLIFAWLYNKFVCCDSGGCCGTKAMAVKAPAPKVVAKAAPKKTAPKKK